MYAKALCSHIWRPSRFILIILRRFSSSVEVSGRTQIPCKRCKSFVKDVLFSVFTWMCRSNHEATASLQVLERQASWYAREKDPYVNTSQLIFLPRGWVLVLLCLAWLPSGISSALPTHPCSQSWSDTMAQSLFYEGWSVPIKERHMRYIYWGLAEFRLPAKEL